MENDTFDDVIWSDETSVQLEFHRRHCFRKADQPPKLKPKPKHPIKVHVWAAISKRGATEVCIFEGKWMQSSISRFFNTIYYHSSAVVMYEYKSTSLLLLGTHFIVITLYYQPYEKGRGYTDRPTQGDF